MHRIVSLTLLCVVASPVLADWPRFRGPNGVGVSEAQLPVAWTDDDYRWQVEMPGAGHSSPVVWGPRLFVTAADADRGVRWLLCYSTETGAELWRREATFEPHRKHNRNSYATSTPAVDETRVYTAWHAPEGSVVLAFDHQGNPAWEHPLPPFQGNHGGGASPIVVDDMVVISNEQEADSFLLAVDRATGQTRWQTPRVKSGASYSTPCLFTYPDGRRELIFTSWQQGITGVDVQTGAVRWEISVFEPESQRRSIGSPVTCGDLVIGTCGFAGGKKILSAVRPTGDGQVEEVYRHERAVAHMPTIVVYNQLIFCWDDKGVATCWRAATGEQVWQERIGGNFAGSPVCADGRLYCLSEDGQMIIIAASETFQELGRVDLPDGSSSTPAISDGVMYFRTRSRLYALPGKAG